MAAAQQPPRAASGASRRKEARPGELVAAALARVETLFESQLASDFPAVNDLCRHVERYRGKMLRPTLVVVCGLAFTDEGAALAPAHDVIAATVEMIKCSRGNATLRTRAPLATTLSIAVLTETLKNVHGSKPQSR